MPTALTDASHLTIVHNHPDWIVVNKPSGVSMQKELESPENPSLLQLSLSAIQALDSSVSRLWPVHRLDKATSGLVIFAKSAQSAALFGQIFSEHLINKHYIAIALGKPKKKQGWIKGDMKKGRNGSWLLMHSHNNPAITHFISSAINADSSVAKRLYLIKPTTGKTHQIRVALKSIGCPILGDTRYKGNEADRCYLHAFRLGFDWQGEHFSFQQPPKQGSWPDLNHIDIL